MAPYDPEMELEPSHVADVAGLEVRRALPRRGRRTVGAWCFADHFGPTPPPDDVQLAVGPHPHTGLYTVTWLLEGTEHHTDSLGSDQLIRPGQLNLMTAGRGVAHAEQSPVGHTGSTHGVQLWVAQPEHTRHGPAAFEHHPELPLTGTGQVRATVLLGSFLDATSPARADTPLVGAQLELSAGRSEIPLRSDFEHALLALDGSLRVDGTDVAADVLVHLPEGAERVLLEAPSSASTDRPVRVLLLGGTPFDETLLMWWNFVVRTKDEAVEAVRDWNEDSGRFGSVASGLDRIASPVPTWA
jgi:redox-sensitive bicupin YhaK (pirin superfamily)